MSETSEEIGNKDRQPHGVTVKRLVMLIGRVFFCSGSFLFLLFSVLILINGHDQTLIGVVKEVRVFMVASCAMLFGIGVNSAT